MTLAITVPGFVLTFIRSLWALSSLYSVTSPLLLLPPPPSLLLPPSSSPPPPSFFSAATLTPARNDHNIACVRPIVKRGRVTFRKGDLNEAAGAADASRARKWRECRDRDIVGP